MALDLVPTKIRGKSLRVQLFARRKLSQFIPGPRLPGREHAILDEITDLAPAALTRQLGFSSLISSGNEAVTDMVDYIEYFAEDDATRAVCLVIERIDRPQPFFAAVERARAAGKPVIALKLGKSARGREIQKVAHTFRSDFG